jgi:D-amino-acid dehydrogenase
MSLHVAVIGSGIIGAIAACEALRDGHEVTVIDAGPPGGEHAASYGNAAWISEGTVMPVSTPGLWREVPGYLMDPLGPFAIRWRHLPKILPWLVKFVMAGATVAKIEATARARRALVATSIERYRGLAEEAGLSHLLRRNGLLFVYPSRREFEAEGLGWRLRRELGLTWQEFDADGLRRLEPGLGDAYRFGALLNEGAHLTDPGAFVAGLVAHVVRNGGRFVEAGATGFRIGSGRLAAVLTDRGEIACDRALVCAGIGSRELARKAGDVVPLESERGYHLVIPDPAYAPRHPIMPSDGKMGVTLTDAGLRIAGQVELAGTQAPPDWRRADILRAHLKRILPGVEADPAREARWMGHRPSTPDGLPCLGPASASPDIVYGFGHGHSGICMGPLSARLIVDLATGTRPVVDPAPYAAGRFR